MAGNIQLSAKAASKPKNNAGEKAAFLFLKLGGQGMTAFWCAALILPLILLFALSAPFRQNLLEREVNAALEQNNDVRKLGAHISPWQMNGAAMQTGSWWTMRGSDSLAVVFPVMYDGIFAPFLVVIGVNGSVELLPLSENAAVLSKRLSPGMLEMYTRRLVPAAQRIAEALKKKSAGGA